MDALRPTQPVVDPVVVRAEPVPHTPDHRLGAALHLDLPVDRADVALHRVGGEVRERRDLLVALALRDEREDLRLMDSAN